MMPPEEDPWERRLRKRRNAVRHVRGTATYTTCVLLRLPMPPQPDPEDRSVSKRQWELSIQVWRRLLAALAADACSL
jgi:hypothetical protein